MRAAGAAVAAGGERLARTVKRVGAAGEESLLAQADAMAALSVRWVLACLWRPMSARDSRRRASGDVRWRVDEGLLVMWRGLRVSWSRAGSPRG